MENNFKTPLPEGLQWPIDTSFQWFAVDHDGEAYFFAETPYVRSVKGRWLNASLSYLFFGIIPELADNWQNSLVKRPETATTSKHDTGSNCCFGQVSQFGFCSKCGEHCEEVEAE